MSEIRGLLREGEEAYSRGDKEEARRLFVEVAERDPECAEAWNDLGAVHYDTGRHDEAEAAFRLALGITPDDVDALANLGRLLCERDREDEARACLARLEELAPGDPGCQWLRQTLGTEDDLWARIAGRFLPASARIAVVGEGPARRSLARQGLLMGGIETAEALVCCGTRADALPNPDALPPQIPWIMAYPEGEVPPLPEGWECLASFARSGPRVNAPYRDRRLDGRGPAQLEVWVREGVATTGVDRALTRPLHALIIDPSREAGRLHRGLRGGLDALGIGWTPLDDRLVAACAPPGSTPAGYALVAGRLAPSFVLLTSGTPQAAEIESELLRAGLTVITVGGPEGQPESRADAHLPWPARSRQFPELLLRTLRACGEAVHATGEGGGESEPLLSAIVYGARDAEATRATLSALATQDLPAAFFEVIVARSAAAPGFELDAGSPWPFTLREATSTVESDGALANAGAALARSQTLWLLSAGACPLGDAGLRHLAHHTSPAGEAAECVVAGIMEHAPEQRHAAVCDLIERTGLTREPVTGPHAAWPAVLPTNLSLPRSVLERGEGFDEDMTGGIGIFAAVWRAANAAPLTVTRDVRIRAQRLRPLGFTELMAEAHAIGRGLRDLADRYDDPQLLPGCKGRARPYLIEQRHIWEEGRRGCDLPGDRARFERDLKTGGLVTINDPRYSKLLCAHYADSLRTGLLHDPQPEPAEARAALEERPLSIIIPNLNGFPHVKNTIASLREHTEGPIQTIVVDNGSTDGSRGWLARQPDLDLISLEENVGAPRARNIGLRRATGATLLFADNDVVFTPRWRSRMSGHLSRWPQIGLVGPMSDYVAGSQKTRERPLPGESLDAFAQRFHEDHAGEHNYTWRLISFCVLVRREVIDRIGGFDETFSPWGFEDDDFSLRAAIAGYDLRIARDVFIRHLGSQTAKTSNLDYDAILATNWRAFREKWGLPADASRGASYQAEPLVARPYAAPRDYCAYEEAVRGANA